MPGAGEDAARSPEGVRKLASGAWGPPQRKQACSLQPAKDMRGEGERSREPKASL